MPRDLDTLEPRERPDLALPFFPTLLRDARDLERDFADASTGSIGRSDKTSVRLTRAASFLSLERLTNIILNLVLKECAIIRCAPCLPGCALPAINTLSKRSGSHSAVSSKVPTNVSSAGATAEHPF